MVLPFVEFQLLGKSLLNLPMIVENKGFQESMEPYHCKLDQGQWSFGKILTMR